MGSSFLSKKSSTKKPPGKISATSVIITEGTTHKQIACISLEEKNEKSAAKSAKIERDQDFSQLHDVDLEAVSLSSLKPQLEPNHPDVSSEDILRQYDDEIEASEGLTSYSEFDLDASNLFNDFSSSKLNFEDDDEFKLLRELLSLSLHENLFKKPKGILKKPMNLNAEKNLKVHRKISFNAKVMVSETFSEEDYQRKGEFVAQILTPEVALLIKNELNSFKKEMEVHDDSRQNTQFYQV